MTAPTTLSIASWKFTLRPPEDAPKLRLLLGRILAERFETMTQAQGPWTDLALHTLGWKAFQDLCAQVCEDILNIPIEIYREAQDGGQDAVFVTKSGLGIPSKNATVQCKYSSHFSRTLKASDLRAEVEHIQDLKAKGHADTYVFMTSMSVSAPVALQIKLELRSLGVLHPHVLGKEFLVRVIRSSTRLRALVPRIYGLGDLSMILDERKAAQTKALLGHILPTLKSYVPTAPHVKAVKALATHKIVLLVGDPATGKSTIGAVLATIAADDPNHRSYKSDGPVGALDNWNPNEGGGFYWIDDAFGPNQMREDYVDNWISIMPMVQAATAAGNRFVLTSRRHIYEAARHKLGTRNHPLFLSGRAVVDVGDLTVEERRQILYNHIKAGSQPSSWKQAVSGELEVIANEPLLTPEIARQLGDPNYTSNIKWPTRQALQQFVRNNKEYLLQTIRELSKSHRAALTLVFIHGGQMPIGAPKPEMQELVVRHYNVDRETLAASLMQLKDSFIVEKADSGRQFWSFKHPTLADALAATLGEADGMRELYLRGVTAKTILSDVICENVDPIPDAIIVPSTLDGLLLERLLEVEDDVVRLNGLLFSFLARRASDTLFRAFAEKTPSVFKRVANGPYYSAFHSKVQLYARAHRLGMLAAERRAEMVQILEADVFGNLDTSILNEADILALFPPKKLITLSRRVRTELLPAIEVKIDEIIEGADLDIEPADNFEEISSNLSDLEIFFGDDDEGIDKHGDALVTLEYGINKVAEKKEEAERRAAREDDDWHWKNYAPSKPEVVAQPDSLSVSNTSSPRSMFSDVAD
jgi:hypothetical protein